MSTGHEASPSRTRPGQSVADRRDDIARLLADAPDGLSDGELARALGDGVRPQTVNALCRRMTAEGRVERTGTRPIRNRLVVVEVDPPLEVVAPPADPPLEVVAAPADGDPVDGSDTPSPVGVSLPEIGSPPGDEPEAVGEPEPVAVPAEAEAEAEPEAEPEAAPEAAGAGPEDAAPAEARAVRPVRDALQAWSRTVNVQAAVAHWLCERGATIRSATLDGSTAARDLVARLDGDDVHVEVTGWPPDGDRTHPTTIAADWFSAAARAAVRRRDARPHARIVIALPDTRRYRALAAGDAALAGARTEVWFVDPSGAVDAAAGRDHLTAR